jgi:hypothetical protein
VYLSPVGAFTGDDKRRGLLGRNLISSPFVADNFIQIERDLRIASLAAHLN